MKDKNNYIKLIPAIIQDFRTGEVLMLAYMSKESLKKTIETGNTWFYSRSRQELWKKGGTSGNIQEVKDIRYDCDSDTLLLKVKQTGSACHTGEKSCFFSTLDIKDSPADFSDIEKKIEAFKYSRYAGEEDINPANAGIEILQELYEVISGRIKNKAKNSYTYELYEKGLSEIVKKVGEESVEVILAAQNESRERLISEIADLIYHLLVLMAGKKITLDDVFKELKARRK